MSRLAWIVGLLPGLAACLLPAGPAGDRGVLLAGAFGSAVLLVAMWTWTKERAALPSTRQILVVAAVARLLVWAGPVRFDDDIWRYLWDGMTTVTGVSPYRFSPQQVLEYDPVFDPLLYGEEDAHELSFLARRAGDAKPRRVLERINFPHLPTIYPPASQLVFAAAAAVVPASERLWRAVTAGADLLTVFVLLRLLAALGRPRWWAAVYALHPLPTLEFAAGAHQDALGILALAAAALALLRLRRGLAGGFLALAGGVKLFPFILVLPWARHLGWRGFLTLTTVTGVTALPFLMLGPAQPAGLSAYVRGWEFFSGPYALLGAGAAVLGLGFLGARALLAAVLAVLALVDRFWRRREIVQVLSGGGRWIEVLLVVSPVIDPWYVPWGMAIGALRFSLAWTLFGALVPLAYFGFTTEGHPWALRCLVWVPFLLLWWREIRSLGHRSGKNDLSK